MKRLSRILLATLLVVNAAGCRSARVPTDASRDYLTDVAPQNDDGTFNAVIEIPAGTTAKFIVSEDGHLVQERTEDGALRFVRYLAYPANYGIIPGTRLPESAGGDGDPLDVVVLGDALDRGATARVRLLGVLQLTDDGEADDKLIAARPGTPLGEARSISDLNDQFPGATEILETWFTSYESGNASEGFDSPDAARAMVRHGTKAFEREGR
jgi:inorganic pyrophosphatase